MNGYLSNNDDDGGDDDGPVNFGPDGPRTNIISMSTEKYIVVKAFFDAGKS